MTLPKSHIKMKKKTSSSPGGGLYMPQGIEAALELAKTSRDVVIGVNM